MLQFPANSVLRHLRKRFLGSLDSARAPAVAFAIGMVASIGGAYLAEEAVRSEKQVEINKQVDHIAHNIEKGFSMCESLLNAISRSTEPTTLNPLEGIRGILLRELLAKHYQDVTYIAFVRQVPSDALPGYERSMQSQLNIDESGLPNYRLRSRPNQQEHFLLETIIPASANVPLGAEIGRNTEFLAAMATFRSGTTSAFIHLRKAPAPLAQTPNLLLAPAWDPLNGQVLPGLLVLGIDMDKLVSISVDENEFRNWGIRITSSSMPSPEKEGMELFAGTARRPGALAAAFTRTSLSRRIQFGGATLVVRTRPEPGSEPISNYVFPVAVFLVGLLISSLLFFLVRQLRLSRVLAEENAHRLGKEAERNIQRFRDLVESSSDWIWEVDGKYRFSYASPTTQSYFGIAPEKLKGVPIETLIERSSSHGNRPFPFPLDRPVAYGGFERSLRGVDGSILTFESTGTPIIDEFGSFSGMRGIDRDVTAQRRVQKRLSMLRQDLSASMQSNLVNQLLSGLAHELNQPLSAIASYNQACVRLLNQEPIDLDEIRTAMQATTNHALLAAEVVSRVRRLTVQRTPQITDVDLSAVVRNTLQLIEFRTSAKDIAFDVHVPESLPHAAADAILVTQVLLNIVNNAIDAVCESPTRQIRIVGEAMTSGKIRLSVTDSGPGIVTPEPDKVFEPYFTTKMDGMGLGLTISRSIIEALEGTLNYSSNPSGGTTFAVTLPAIAV